MPLSTLTTTQLLKLADFRRDDAAALDEALASYPVRAFEYTYTLIFAHADGSDEEGDGSEEAPYGSFLYAHSKIPAIGAPGVLYVLVLTGLGVETLPDDFELPTWTCTSAFGGGGVLWVAAPQLATDLTEEEATITAWAVNTDSDTGHISVVPTVSKAWAPGALKGKFLSAGDEPEGNGPVIWDNTADAIFLTSVDAEDWESSEELTTLTITECSAELRGHSEGNFRGAITCNSPNNLRIQGISIVPTDPAESAGFAQTGGLVWFSGCNLVRPTINAPTRMIPLENCNVVEPQLGGEIYGRGSRIADAGTNEWQGIWLNRPANQGVSMFDGTVLDGCTTIKVVETTSVDSNGTTLGGALTMSHVKIINSIGDAIYWPGGTASLLAVDISDSVADAGGDPEEGGTVASDGNAFVGRGGLLALLDGVTGTGNEGDGVVALDGAQIEVTDDTTVTGDGDDMKVGDLAAQSYPASPFSRLDITYDPTAGAPTQATGTGARIFNRG